jgi:hypothetical protein
VRVFYDTEFIEDGRTIDLISIGMVAEDGRELYLANRDMPVRRIRRHPWLMANVVPHLPRGSGDMRNSMGRRWLFHYGDPRVQPRKVIARKVREFLAATPDAELWADYGAYDHVVLAQLFGTMMDLPAGVPMFTHDIRQLAAGRTDLPEQTSTEHNALADARHVRDLHAFLTGAG